MGCTLEEPPPSFYYTVINQVGVAIELSCPECNTVKVSKASTTAFGSNVQFSEYAIRPEISIAPNTIGIAEDSPGTFRVFQQ
jgi:hypothetical protein